MHAKSFDSMRIAEGYTKRPWLHKSVIGRIINDYPEIDCYKNGLDVGCGAGLSTKALKLITDKVTGTDISEAMISVCQREFDDEKYMFYCAKAEETKIPTYLYDIVTAAGVLNWIDKKLFFQNMNQVMSLEGLLIIYDFWITNQMDEESAYTDWYDNKYLKEFPKPKRNEEILNQKHLGNGFLLEKQVTYNMVYEFEFNEFVDFMMIQSNVNACIEHGIRDIKSVRKWLEETLKPIFDNDKKRLIFEGYSWYVRKHEL